MMILQIFLLTFPALPAEFAGEIIETVHILDTIETGSQNTTNHTV
jgi:hypothetical protein